ncbi:MAG: bifunctional helix-turn-helix transcriptional regulator/GNAT family N-acetyltransferase [Blastocatellia bacterium]|nr:bifunctional helix-turn-helix transcriptional regulator/GNAT family N-acetyltransferase [Blastocatellia bacterium]
MENSVLQRNADRLRHFNRFYTQRIGVLQEGWLESPFSLTEVRILYEIAHHQNVTAKELTKNLGLDAGYVSRILKSFRKHDLVAATPSPTDGRQSHLALTEKGMEAFAPLNERAQKEMAGLLGSLSEGHQVRLMEALKAIETILNPPPPPATPYLLRTHQPGDMGWVLYRHAVLYAQEYGWDERFETLVAEIVTDFLKNFDSKKERCWMAEKDGEIVGSVFLVKKSETVAKLRLLLVEPQARGLGIGKRLVQECTRFARQAGYQKITLWTNQVLTSARKIYEDEGYKLVEAVPHDLFGTNMIAETWELDL